MATQEAPTADGSREGEEPEERYWPPDIEKQFDLGRITAGQADMMSRGSKPPEPAAESPDAAQTAPPEGTAPEAHEEPGGQLRIPGLPEPPENPEHN